MGTLRRLSLLAILLLASLASAGCLELEAAAVPDRFLEGRGGNGWARNDAASQAEPQSAEGGMAKTQTFAYEDRESEDGYPGTLTVTTLRTLLRPSEDKVLALVEERIQAEARNKGIRLDGPGTSGTRTLANGAEGNWFAYNGTATRQGTFRQDAQIKIFGEVFQCVETRTVVAVVGLAQTSDVRSVGGVTLPNEPDPTTWREIVADPRGSIQGIRGSAGLAYNVRC